MLALVLSAVMTDTVAIAASKSQCYGTTSNGHLKGGVKLPQDGENFVSYGTIPALMGRTYVHSTVRDTLLDAYARLAKSHPDVVFMFAETGYKDGGPFEPHKTHQNGLSVDFMVPVRDATGASALLPTFVWNRYGYDIEFDQQGRWKGLTIDFEALGAHIVALDQAAKANGIELWRVLLTPEFQEKLYATSSGTYIRNHVTIPNKRSWVRHDEHIHVDFAVPCADRSE